MNPPGTVEFDKTGAELARQYATAGATIKMWTDFRMGVRERLVGLIGGADAGLYQGEQVLTVIRTRPRRFNVHAFSADHPDLFEQYREQAEEDEIRLSVKIESLPEEPADA